MEIKSLFTRRAISRRTSSLTMERARDPTRGPRVRGLIRPGGIISPPTFKDLARV